MILFFKLLLAHFLGDFLLQPNRWVAEKEAKKLRSPLLYIHALLHGILVFLLSGGIHFMLPATIIAVTHLLIDTGKLYLQTENNKKILFFADQALHITMLAIVWYWYQAPAIPAASLLTEKRLIVITAIVALTIPSSVLIKLLISKWSPHTGELAGDSLSQAGMYIGILERLFVLAFVLTDHWEAIGFLITAKSVFRFGDLREAKERRLTEYILMGTLVSFGIALFTGLIVAYLMRVIVT